MPCWLVGTALLIGALLASSQLPADVAILDGLDPYATTADPAASAPGALAVGGDRVQAGSFCQDAHSAGHCSSCPACTLPAFVPPPSFAGGSIWSIPSTIPPTTPGAGGPFHPPTS